MASRPNRPDTLRPPAPGSVETVSLRRSAPIAGMPVERSDPMPSVPSTIPPPMAVPSTGASAPGPRPARNRSSESALAAAAAAMAAALLPAEEPAQALRSPSSRPARIAPETPPPPPKRARTSSAPPRPDPRSEGGGGVYAERVRASVDARSASIPEAPTPDRRQRIDALVHALARSGPENDVPLRQSLLALGPDALAPLCRAFPGALWVDLSRPHRPLRSARDLSAVAACLSAFGADAVAHVPALLRASRPEVRLSAALVSADLADGALVRALAARLWDEIPAVRNAAMIALTASSELPEMRALRGELVGTLEDARTPAKWRKKAVWTLGQLRDTGSAALVVEQLAAEAEVARVARQCLTLLVGRDLGRFRVRWHAFLRGRSRSRVEWLIEALDQSDAAARARVIEELILATGEGFDRRHAATSRESARELAAYYRERLSL